jgi:D-alanyl-lipoteichoic acid acyltransferase DltB (MBOAT superfamily)
MGFDLMINFRSPYFVTSPAQFWRHWHISLSSWLRDDLYIPLGGSRSGAVRTRINLALTMILGGLWHGAAWNFVWWGLYQGVLLLLFRSSGTTPKRAGSLRSCLQCLAVFQLTAVGWLIFRAESGAQLAALFQGLMVWPSPDVHFVQQAAGLLFFGGFILWEQFEKYFTNEEVAFSGRPLLVRTVIMIYLLFAIVFMAAPTQQEFVYFQF